MSGFRKLFGLLALGGAAMVLPCAAYASAYEFSSAPTSIDSQLSLGFSFTANSALTISQLGYYDNGGNGFGSPHTVGIFSSSGTLLTSTTLGSGTVDPLTGHFRYQSIVPLTLVAGSTYTLAATTGGPADPFAYGQAGTTITDFQTDLSITIGPDASLYLYQTDNILRDPVNHFANYTLYAGPNFMIVPVPVAEPGTVALLISAITVCWLGSRYCRRS